jgi:hypothetical protein
VKTLLIAISSPLLVLLAAVLLACTAPLAPVLYLTWVLARRHRERQLARVRAVVEAAQRAARQPPLLNPQNN